ncbi:ly-6/neurotoxin-like protein 1 [Acanthaster planci]|uniref:Ly-6/neurotoxin-like protein 1 n=1 Tax=Acanthaster planci TaxID=133434 RepID=A0A8B7Y3J0_ACAPL|nr:ly-6/neurotoxin-like protein 1 [Acanthaster planci]
MAWSLILLALVCTPFAVMGEENMYCFKCAANPECETSVRSDSDNVFLGKCQGVCYDRRITHIAYKETLVYRGCYERETDCVPGCFGNEEHMDCVKCCNKNMCNGAGVVTYSLPIVLLAWLVTRIVSR